MLFLWTDYALESVVDFSEGLKSMKIDYFALNNAGAQKAVEAMVAQNWQLALPDKVFVIEDQVVPANSPEVSEAQQKMAAFARNYGTEYIYGQAFASHYLVDEVLKGGEVVVSADKDILMVGAVGATGLVLSADELAEALVKGSVAVEAKQTFGIKIIGQLKAEADITTAARKLIKALQAVPSNTVIEFYTEATLTLSEKMILCGYCQKLGALSAIFVAEQAKTDYVLDLGAVDTERLNTTVNAVFIGGAYGGNLEAIQKTAELVAGKEIADKVRLSVAPANAKIYIGAANAGYIETIINAGGLVLNQCALPPVQARIGVGEVMLSNDMHDEQDYAGEGGKIYLTSTEVAVKAALAGRIGGEC